MTVNTKITNTVSMLSPPLLLHPPDKRFQLLLVDLEGPAARSWHPDAYPEINLLFVDRFSQEQFCPFQFSCRFLYGHDYLLTITQGFAPLRFVPP